MDLNGRKRLDFDILISGVDILTYHYYIVHTPKKKKKNRLNHTFSNRGLWMGRHQSFSGSFLNYFLFFFILVKIIC